MESKIRKPLSAAHDLSRLPTPRSSSRLKPPPVVSDKSATNKRSRSPDEIRKPLSAAHNLSRLPTPRSSSRLKPPSVVSDKSATNKRSRSPDETPFAKRQRRECENLIIITESSSIGFQHSSSTGSLHRPNNPPRKLQSSLSSSSLKGDNSVTATSRHYQTAMVKQSVLKPPKSAAALPKPPVTGRVSNIRPSSSINNSFAVSAGSSGNSNKKRPAWDLKGRLQDMEEQMKGKEKEKNDFFCQMQQWSERIAVLEERNSTLSGTVAQKEEHFTNASNELEKLQKKNRDTESELYELRKQFDRDTENFEFTKATFKRQKAALEGELAGLQQEVTGLKASVAQLTSSQAGLKAELETTKAMLEKSLQYSKERDNLVLEQEKMIEEYTCKIREHETVRRQLHNTIQELKGNIRVFCRVRPLLRDEIVGNDGEIHHMQFDDDDKKTLELEKLTDVTLNESLIAGTKRNGSGRYSFNFDRVFDPSSSQEEVFLEISQLVQSALDGYNVCIFAYGQTGSGKTYTMEGPSVEDEDSRGMISRAALQIFACTKDLQDKGWQYEFEASFLEIYNESIRDLLGNHGSEVKHEIKLLGTSGNDVTITNLTTVTVNHEKQITELLKTASANRSVGKTQCNERSSRSHSVFRLKLTGVNEITGEQCKGTLNLVDLAGSERLKESGSTGQRLKETQNINQSLSNLGNVIMALGNKESHIPYRNSKLTYLLQNSLGGNSKTLMFVNVSPKEENFSETLNSLRFAMKVNQCNIGSATKKTK